MIRFVEKPHSIRAGTTMVEVWDDDRLLAGIYAGSGRPMPDSQPIVRVVSLHLDCICPEWSADGLSAVEVHFR